MVEYKGRNITDYFKIYSRSSQKSIPESESANNSLLKRIPSSSLTPLASPNSAADPYPTPSTSRVTAQLDTEPRDTSKSATPSPNPNPECSHQKTGLEPPPTQASTVSSSQRVFRNGEEYVLNSDDESDVSLEDLDEIINRRKTSDSPEPQLNSVQYEAPPKNESELGRGVKRKATGPPLEIRNAPRFSLKDLAAQTKKYESRREDIARTTCLIEVQTEVRRKADIQEGNLVEELMQGRGDHNDTDRLKLAILRTEALHHEVTWSFFEDSDETPEIPDLPNLKDRDLAPLFSKPITRQQTFLSGFVEDIAMKDGLPDELLTWILDVACVEPREDLRQAYANVLRQSTEPLTDQVSPEYLTNLFRRVGGSDAALQLDAPVEPRSFSSESQPNDNTSSKVFPLVDMLHILTPTMSTNTLTHAISILCRLLIDTTITRNPNLLTRIEHLLIDLLSHLHQDESSSPTFHLLTSLYNTTTHPHLRVLLLRNLPLLSPGWLHHRRQLALSWFLSTPPPMPIGHTVSLQDITNALSHPSFTLTNTTNFTSFTSSIQCLDIALDSCDRPPLILSPPPEHHDEHPVTDEHPVFDKQIDTLADKLKKMFLQIVDSGASDMRRTEAKEALEGLRARLLYAVRTRPPKKKRLFWDKDEEERVVEEGMRRGMEGWVERQKATRKEDDFQDAGLEAVIGEV